MTQRSFDKNEDIILCREARAGNSNALNELIEKHIPLVHSVVNRYQTPTVDFDDLLQEGMIGLMFAIRSYSGDRGAAFSTFAHKCVTNRILSALSGSAREPHEQELYELSSRWDDIDPQDLLVTKERIQRWKELLRDNLSPLERDVIRMYLFGYTVRDIAEKVDVPAKSVDNALQRAKRKMRSQ